MDQFKRQFSTAFELETEPQVPGCGPSGPVKIAFLGEAPGQEEALKGQPFVGPAGEFFDKVLCHGAKIWFDGTWRTNVIDRQPPTWNGKNNAINSPSAIEAIEAQKDELWRELEWLIRSKHLKVLVAVGGTASVALGIQGKITDIRGSVYELSLRLRRVLTQEEVQDGVSADCVVIPILHPSGLRRNGWWKRASGTMSDALATIDDLKKVQHIATNGYERPIERFILYPTADEIVAWVDAAIREQVLVSVDTESRGDIDLEPSKRTLTLIGLAWDAQHAISIAFEREDGMKEWSNGSLERIVAVLNRLFTKGRLMFQNALHDVPLLQASGFTVDNRCVEHDTLLMHHAVSPEDKHNLAYIVSRFGVTTFWKDIGLNRKAYDRVYNLRDCVVLHQAKPTLRAAMQKVDPTDRLYNEVYVGETMALLPSVVRMHTTGIKLDRKRLRMWQQFAARKLEKATADLNAVALVPQNFNWSSEHDTQALFFGVYPEEKLRQDRIVLLRSMEDIAAEGQRKRDEVQAEIDKAESAGRTTTKKYAALLEKREKLLEYDAPKYWYESKERLEKFNTLRQMWPGINKWNGRKTEKKDRVSLSKKTYPEMLNFAFKRQEELNALVRPTAEHEAEKAQLNRFIAVTTSYGTYSRVSHVVSTYNTFNTWEDGRVHGRMIQSGTATGRLACVSGSTLLLTNRGMFRFDNYIPQPGDMAWTHKQRWQPIVRKFLKPVDKMYRVRLSNGSMVECTQEHRIWTPDGWTALRNLNIGSEVYSVDQQKTFERPDNLSEGSARIPGKPGQTHVSDNRGSGWNYVSHRARDSKTSCVKGTPVLRKTSTVLTSPDGEELRNGRNESSKLERRLFRRLWLFDQNRGRQSVLRSSYSLRGNAGDTCIGASPKTRSTPHRREPIEQYPKQLVPRYRLRTQKTTCKTYRIVEITPVGTVPVWDIEVAIDHSYYAQGMFHHNSRDPNLQNIPKREQWAEQVRRCFVPEEGSVFLLFDYSNIEFVMLAYTTGEPGFIEIVEKDLNVHDLNAPILFADQGITGPDHPQWKPARRAAKAFQFGGVQYGGGDMEVHRNILADAPELGLTMAQYKRAKARYLNQYKVLDEWQKMVKEVGIKKRRSETPFGRVRLLNGNDRDIEKEALNTPIQGAAAHIINRAQIRIEDRLIGAGLMKGFDSFDGVEPLCRTVLQIHDQLIFECPVHLAYDVVPIIIEEMQQPVQITDWKGARHTVHPKVDPEMGLDMYDTVAIPLREDGTVPPALFGKAIADLAAKPVCFTDTDIEDVDADTFDEETGEEE